MQVSDVTDNRPHHIGKRIGVCRTVVQFFVEFIELFFRHTLVIENLDNTLTVHPLLHKSRDIRNGYLLFEEVFSAVTSNLLCHCDENNNHHHSQNRKQRTKRKH